jgi:hypothetical protein
MPTASTAQEPFQPSFDPIALDPNTYSSCICVYSTSSETLKLFADRYGVQLQGLTIRWKTHLLRILRRWQQVSNERSYFVDEAIADYLNSSFTDLQLHRIDQFISVNVLEALDKLSSDDALHLLAHLETWESEFAGCDRKS